MTFTWTVRVVVTTAVNGSTQKAVDTFTFAKDVPLFVAPGFEDLMFCKFFARFEFLRQRIVRRSIFFDLGQTLLFKTAADVQLEVDTYGECVPPLCEAIPTACEDFQMRCESSPPSFNPPQPDILRARLTVIKSSNWPRKSKRHCATRSSIHSGAGFCYAEHMGTGVGVGLVNRKPGGETGVGRHDGTGSGAGRDRE